MNNFQKYFKKTKFSFHSPYNFDKTFEVSFLFSIQSDCIISYTSSVPSLFIRSILDELEEFNFVC